MMKHFYLFLVLTIIFAGCSTFQEIETHKGEINSGIAYLLNSFMVRNIDLNFQEIKDENIFRIPNFFHEYGKPYFSNYNIGNGTILCLRLTGQLFSGMDEGYDYYILVKLNADSIQALSNSNTVVMHALVWINYVLENINGELKKIISDDEITGSIKINATGYKLFNFHTKKLLRQDSTYNVVLLGNFSASEKQPTKDRSWK